jgi:hypothetical protein
MGKQTLFAVRTIRNTQIHCVGSPYLTGNTSRLRYRVQPVNAVWGKSLCCENCTDHTDTLWAVRTSQETHRCTVGSVQSCNMLKQGVHRELISLTQLMVQNWKVELD